MSGNENGMISVGDVLARAAAEQGAVLPCSPEPEKRRVFQDRGRRMSYWTPYVAVFLDDNKTPKGVLFKALRLPAMVEIEKRKLVNALAVVEYEVDLSARLDGRVRCVMRRKGNGPVFSHFFRDGGLANHSVLCRQAFGAEIGLNPDREWETAWRDVFEEARKIVGRNDQRSGFRDALRSVVRQTPVQQVPVSQQTPVQQVPVSQQTPVQQVPVSQQTPVQQVPVSQQTPVQQVPVSQRLPDVPPDAAAQIEALRATGAVGASLAGLAAQALSAPSVSERSYEALSALRNRR